MQNFEQQSDNFTELKIKEYINKYLKEIQRHFNISDRKMFLILYEIYQDNTFFGYFKKNIKKFFENKKSVLKSIYIKLKFKRKQ